MKIAVVTGGTRGIGLAAAEAFYKRGYIVYALYSSDEESAENARKKMPAAAVVKCDVSDENAVEALFNEIPHVDALINNAGISLVKLFQDTSYAEWKRLFAVNADGAFLCSRAAIKTMLKRKSGNIINISSVWGERGAAEEAAYSATKGALIALTKSLAKEVGYSGVRVNCITPGVIDTRMNSCFSADDKELILSDIPLGRYGSPDEIASAVMFIIDNEYINGAVIPVNGGF